MTQLHKIRNRILRRATEEFHANASLHAQIHGAKIKKLEELIDVENEVTFDKESEEAFERQALKRLEEAKAKHGGQ